jgi:KEOPS complex subunit Pcc1
VRHEATLTFDYDAPDSARRVERAIAPEVGDIDDERGRARADREGATLSVTIEARDPVALRASLNTWLSLVGVAEDAGGVT